MRAVQPFCGSAAAAPHAVSDGGEGGAAGAAGGEGGGRVQGAGGGWRGGAHLVCGIHVHPLLYEAGEGFEVLTCATRRRVAKSLLLSLLLLLRRHLLRRLLRRVTTVDAVTDGERLDGCHGQRPEALLSIGYDDLIVQIADARELLSLLHGNSSLDETALLVG